MKPIEAGCLAIIIGGNYPDNIGKEVRVENKNHVETDIVGQPVWNITPVNGLLKVRRNSKDLSYREQNYALSLERNLMRIDGDKKVIGEYMLGCDIDISLLANNPSVRALIAALTDDERDIDWTKIHTHPRGEE